MKRLVFLCVLLFVGACSKDDDKDSSGSLDGNNPSAQSQTLFDLNRVARGAKLYQENCAQCHGPQAQGHPDWQRARSQGFSAAPPLNGSGTDIKLTRSAMVKVIKKGAKHKGVMVMPAWQGRVSNEQILDIISWYQALWPVETYQAWRRSNIPSAKASSKSQG